MWLSVFGGEAIRTPRERARSSRGVVAIWLPSGCHLVAKGGADGIANDKDRAAVDCTCDPGELLWDTELRRFGARCRASGSIAYFIKPRIDGRQRWVTLGKHGPPTQPRRARRLGRYSPRSIAAAIERASARRVAGCRCSPSLLSDGLTSM